VFFQMMLFMWMFILDLAAICRLSDEAKDLELLLLRQQLRIVERRQKRGPQIPRWQKIPLSALVHRLVQTAANAPRIVRLGRMPQPSAGFALPARSVSITSHCE
jgi:hypothetical protein